MILAALLLVTTAAPAQWATYNRDSLIALLDPQERSFEQLHRYHLLAGSWQLSKKANRFLPYMDTISRALATHPDERTRWHVTVRRSLYHYMMGYQAKFDRNIPRALWHMERSCTLLDSIGHGDALARNLQAIGVLYASVGEEELAWKHFTQGLKLALADDPDDPENQHHIRLHMADRLAARREWSRADSVLALCDTSMVDVHLLALTLRARMHAMIGRFELAEATFQRALFRAKDGKDEWGSIDVLSHLARMRSQIGDHRGAQKAARQCAEIAARTGDEAAWCSCMIIVGQERLAMGDANGAEADLRAALDTARHYGYIGLSRETGDEGSMVNAAGLLKELYLRDGRLDEAVEMTTYWSALKDTLNRMDGRLDVLRHRMRMQIQADSLDSAKLLALAQCQREEADEQASRARQRVVGLSAITLLLALVALLLLRAMRNRKRLALQERELHVKQVDELLHQQEIKAINAMLEGQEKERDRMAKDLHDRLGSMLSAIKMQVGALEGGVQEVRSTQETQHSKVERLLDEAVGEVRRISHDMVTTTLSRFGLAKALEDLCDSVRVSGRLAVELQLFGLEQRLERSVEITVYRIIQELVSNVLKHAQAGELSISITRSPGRLSVMVTDDGKGFDPALAGKGIGLQNVRSRAATLGATVQLDSVPDKGTTVSVECPVVE